MYFFYKYARDCSIPEENELVREVKLNKQTKNCTNDRPFT